jgi:hypothetical protein
VTADGLTLDGVFSFGTLVDGFVNSPASLYVNFDSDNNSAGEAFVIGSNRTSASGGNEHFRVNASGNVGIGTDSPVSPLTTSIGAGSAGSLNNQIAMTHSGASNSYHIKTIRATANDEPAGLAFVENTTERMRIDSSGNLLVGGITNDTPGLGDTDVGASFRADGASFVSRTLSDTSGSTLYVNRNTNNGNLVQFQKDGTTVGSIGSVSFGVAGISFVNPTYGGIRTADYRINPNRFKNLYLSGDLALTESFVFGNTDGLNLRANSGKVISMQIAGSEKARIDSSGNFLVGRTSVAGSATDYGMQVYSSGLLYLYANASGDDDIFRGHNSAGTNTSAIEADGDYIDLSDSRFKENIVDAPSVINTIKNIPVRSFDWKDRSYGQTYGFIAQELNGVCPEVVKVPKSEEDVWGVKNSKVVPMLVKAIQEQQDLIESLTARIAALEGAN